MDQLMWRERCTSHTPLQRVNLTRALHIDFSTEKERPPGVHLRGDKALTSRRDSGASARELHERRRTLKLPMSLTVEAVVEQGPT